MELWPLALYAGLAVLVVLAIFFGSAWFVNSAKKGNMRFKWGGRAPPDRADR